MFVQVGFQGERLVAPLALEVLERGMCLHMGPEVGPVGEGLTTMSAPERFLACVRPHVALKQPGPGEGFATDVASMAQVVGQDMHSQGGHRDVDFVACGTLFGQLRVDAAVGLLVTGEVGGRCIIFAAFGARIARSVLARLGGC